MYFQFYCVWGLWQMEVTPVTRLEVFMARTIKIAIFLECDAV